MGFASPVYSITQAWLLIEVFLGLCALQYGAIFKSHENVPGYARWFIWLFWALLAALLPFGAKWTALLFLCVSLGIFAIRPRANMIVFSQSFWLHARFGLLALLFLLIPYFRDPGLAVYSFYGSDLWGYVRVADWIKDHALRDLPSLDVRRCEPMLNWVHFVLNKGERPLIYEGLSLVSSFSLVSGLSAYQALAASLMGGLGVQVWKFCKQKGYAIWVCGFSVISMMFQPIWIQHYFHQFYAGFFVVGLSGVALLSGPRESGIKRIFVFGFLLSLLYSVNLALLLVATWILTRVGEFEVQSRFDSKKMLHGLLVLVILLGASPLWFKAFGAEDPYLQSGTSKYFPHQLCALSGIGLIEPFCFPNRAQWLDRISLEWAENWGSLAVWVGALLWPVIVSIVRISGIAGSRWTGFAYWIAMMVPLFLSMPPHGSHYLLCRVLPWVGMIGMIILIHSKMLIARIAGVAPLLIALWSGIYSDPVFQFRPELHTPRGPIAESGWECLAWGYHFKPKSLDPWKTNPPCIESMTDFMPDKASLRDPRFEACPPYP